MQPDRSLALACGGLTAMAAAIGIGRFVYTPILPAMFGALSWSKADAGLVASANFLGYFLGALLAGHSLVAARPRFWPPFVSSAASPARSSSCARQPWNWNALAIQTSLATAADRRGELTEIDE
jgi:MFS family permease